MDKIAVLLEDVQSNQTKQMAMILTQGSSASEKRKLEEQMATLKKSYFEAVMVRWRESGREYFVYIYIFLWPRLTIAYGLILRHKGAFGFFYELRF